MARRNVAVYLVREDGEVPFKGQLATLGLALECVNQRGIRIANTGDAPVRSDRSRRPIKPGHSAVLPRNTVLSVGETSVRFL